MPLKSAACLVAGSMLLAVGSATTRAATPQEVEAAIQKAEKYLITQQNQFGNWETVQQPNAAGGNADVAGKQWGGLTSIVTYALLAAGTSPQAPELAKPIAFLKAANIEGIYAAGLRCQVWYLLDDDKLQPYLARDANTLLNGIHVNPAMDSYGFYPYFFVKPPIDNWYDRSVSQYGVLGAWALEEAGVEIPTKYWQLVDAAWRRAQHRDGGWNYNAGAAPESTAPMTAAGIATLFITQDNLLGNLAECRGNIVNRNIDAGLAWMDRHIHEALGGNYYGMYGIERIGVASGRKYFETVDWYKDGADFIVKSQQPNGSWGAGLPDTCFALLFLVRGRAPIAMNKLEYEILDRNKVQDGPWNERPRDCANFAHWMGRNIEEHNLNWQVVNLKVTPEELHDSQILYIAGNKELTFSTGDIAKLRTFVEEGGLILGNSDCESIAFTKSFTQLASKMFPKYEFRELPTDHVIFTEQFNAAKWRPRPKVMGLSNGVRELMLLAPTADLSRAWQSRNEKTKADLFQLGANIVLYSVDKKNLEKKGETYLVADNPAVPITRHIALGRLQVGDNPNPEPGGWPRLAAILHNEQKVGLDVKEVKCDVAEFKGLKILHLTGTTAFKLTDEKRAALRDFVNSGGTLIVDAAGGSILFADSAEAELKSIFGTDGNVLPITSPIYNLPGEVIPSVAWRNFTRRYLNGNKSIRVKGTLVKGRLAVFYSREDLSAGLVGEQMDGILGYDPASATAIMRNLVMFGAFGFPPPPATTQSTTRPTTVPATRPTTTPAAPVPPTPPPTAPPARK